MKKRQYSVQSMQKAIKYVICKKGSVREAARRFGVPRSSIQYKVTHPNTKSTSGPSTILNDDEENALANLMISLAKCGFPRKKLDIQISAQKLLEANPRKNPFPKNKPNTGWFTAFLRRHPEITMSVDSNLCPTEDDIKAWYQCIRHYISEEQLFCVVTDPKRLFKADETVFKCCPETEKVYLDQLPHPKSNEKIMILFSFSATGTATNPMLIYDETLSSKTVETMPRGWGIALSNSGKITADSFYYYIKNVFYPDLLSKNIKFPIILFVDRKTPVTLDTAELCKKNQIHLIAMYPNGTRIQASVCQPLKTCWRKALRSSNKTPLTKFTFASLFENVFNAHTKDEILVEAFHKLGLFPFDEDNIDCTKECVVFKDKVEVIEYESEDNSMYYKKQIDSKQDLDLSIDIGTSKENNRTEDIYQEITERPRSLKEKPLLIEEKVDHLEEETEIELSETAEYIVSDNSDVETIALPICDICLDNISGRIVECKKCLNKYHYNCIPKFHKIHISADDDEFICHICF